MIVMHGIFELKDGVGDQAFRDAYERFAGHLRDKDLLVGWRFLRRHPHGFDLQVGERGMGLSGGQRQTIAIARALLPDPPILLLDEPTSNMDNASETRFRQRLVQSLSGKTLVLITHRSSLLDLVDRLIIMDAGKIIANGAKEDVLAALKQGKIKTSQ